MDTVIRLIRKIKTENVDEYGDPVYDEEYIDVLAEQTSVGYSEFYQAMTAGYKPEIRFIIYDLFAYHGEDEVIHENMRYKVLRTYNSGDSIEMTCYGGVHIGNA